MRKSIFWIVMILFFVQLSFAVQRKPVEEINSDEFTQDTQATCKNVGDDHLAVIWWIPNEFWESIFSRDNSISYSEKQEFISYLEGISLLAVIQGDITDYGSINFYTEDEVKQNMLISATDSSGERHKLTPLSDINSELEYFISIFKPILASSMGNMGLNMHFFVLNDMKGDSKRLLDPYLKGNLSVELKKKNYQVITGNVELPLNSLFYPRKCPNGKDAHISWKFCPWTGSKLED